MVDEQHYDRADDCDKHAVKVEAIDTSCAELGKEEPAHDRPYNSQYDVEDHPFTRLVDDLAGNEASDQTIDIRNSTLESSAG
jgi:hypothetical protein